MILLAADASASEACIDESEGKEGLNVLLALFLCARTEQQEEEKND